RESLRTRFLKLSPGKVQRRRGCVQEGDSAFARDGKGTLRTKPRLPGTGYDVAIDGGIPDPGTTRSDPGEEVGSDVPAVQLFVPAGSRLPLIHRLHRLVSESA